MEEKRRAPRINEDDDVTITVVSEELNLPEKEISGNHIKDISVCGAKIQTNILLPVNTLLELYFTSKGVRQPIKILGKVLWNKVINENESYEFGVEFYLSKEMGKLDYYISRQLESNKFKFIKNEVPLVDSGHINIAETKKVPPTDSYNKNITETEKAPQNKKWINIAIISLGTMISIVVLLNIFSSISRNFIYPPANKKVANNIAHDSITTEQTTLPAPPIVAQAPKVTPSSSPGPTTAPVPAAEATQKIKVIGNSDSKMYYLPGIKYYNTVKAYHRVEFDSEKDAIKAGYSKAPR